MAGISLTLLVSQLPALTGVDLHSPGLLRPLIELVVRNAEIHWAGLAFGLFLLALLRLGKIFVPRVPGSAVVVVIAIAASALFDFRGEGFEVLGPIPGGLPHPKLPSFAANPISLVEAAAGLLIVSFSSGILTSRAFGRQVNARNKPNRELAGFGAADLAAGLFQGFAVTGADSRTAVALSSGGKSSLVGILAVTTIAFVALFLTGPLALLPATALAAILISAGLDLIDIKGFVHLARIDRAELIFALIAAAGVIWIGVLEGVAIAVAATFLHLIRLASRPRDGVMGRAPESGDLVTLRRQRADHGRPSGGRALPDHRPRRGGNSVGRLRRSRRGCRRGFRRGRCQAERRCAHRDPPHRRHHIRLREPGREQVLDIVFSLAVRRGQETLVVLGGEMGSQQPHRGDVQASSRQHLNDGGKPSRRASGLDPVVRRILGQPQDCRAVLEERRKPLAFVEAPRVEFGEMRDERRGGLALASGEATERRRQRVIIETGHRSDRHGQ